MKVRHAVAVVLVVILALAGEALQAEEMTLTGEVGAATCGLTHAGPSAEVCTKQCVLKGSAYALIVDDKFYQLDASDALGPKGADQIKAQLSKLAGKMATVTGNVMGADIKVSSVKAVKKKGDAVSRGKIFD
jgi:hypothetical protein